MRNILISHLKDEDYSHGYLRYLNQVNHVKYL